MWPLPIWQCQFFPLSQRADNSEFNRTVWKDESAYYGIHFELTLIDHNIYGIFLSKTLFWATNHTVWFLENMLLRSLNAMWSGQLFLFESRTPDLMYNIHPTHTCRSLVMHMQERIGRSLVAAWQLIINSLHVQTLKSLAPTNIISWWFSQQLGRNGVFDVYQLSISLT